MGGGRRFPYPKHVWTPFGGWWPNPENWKRNTFALMVTSYSITYLLYLWGEKNTVSNLYS